jgi:hypothetical protein
MAVDTIPKVEAVTLTIRVPKDLQNRFDEAARIISEIYPQKPVIPTDLMSFALFKETTSAIVIEFLEFVANCDNSVLAENGSSPPEPVVKSGTTRY